MDVGEFPWKRETCITWLLSEAKRINCMRRLTLYFFPAFDEAVIQLRLQHRQAVLLPADAAPGLGGGASDTDAGVADTG